MRRLLTLLLAVSLGAPSTAAAGPAFAAGRWAISHVGRGADRVALAFTYASGVPGSDRYGRYETSRDVPLGALGIAPERLSGPAGPIAFALEREAGTFTCTGSAGHGSGAGSFRYRSSPSFAAALAARGIAQPDIERSVVLAMEDVTLELIDSVGGPGRRPTLDDIVRLAEHGVDERFVGELATFGYPQLAADALIALSDHGVEIRLIDALQRAGYGRASTDDLVRLADHGVSADYVAALAKRGYARISVDDLVDLADHGVTVSFIDRLQAHGHANVPVSDLIRLRDDGP